MSLGEPNNKSALNVLYDRMSFELNNNNSVFNDNENITLVIEGGGMRGIYAAGMLCALNDLGLTKYIDHIFACSVGAHLACYFIANQADTARDIFFEEALDRNFSSLKNIITKGKILDVRWMVKNVYFGSKKFDFDRMKASKTGLTIACTDVNTITTEYFVKNYPENVMQDILCATANIPIIAGKPVKINQKLYTDGGYTDQIPIEAAERAGATKILVLLTRKKTSKRKSLYRIAHLFEKAMIRIFLGREMAKSFDLRRIRTNKMLDIIERGETEKGTPIEALYVPKETKYLSRLSKDVPELKRSAGICYTNTIDYIRSAMKKSHK